MPKISVVIPAKNEENSIGSVLERVKLVLGADSEIVVVDDGSSDGTKEIAIAAGAKVVSHPYSKGNGAAIKSGAAAATGEVVVFMDADMQHSPHDIERLLEKIDDGFDMVVGARSGGSQATPMRGIANKFYNWLATKMVGHRVLDLTSGFRAIRREKFLRYLFLLPNGFSYPTTITMAFFRAGFSVAYVPIEAGARVGKSHIKPLKDGVRFLLIIFKIATLYSPLKIFFPVSAMLLALGILHYAVNYISYGRFTNMSLLLFTSSVVIMMMGLLSEQITSLLYSGTSGRDSESA